MRVEQVKSVGDNFAYIVWDEEGHKAIVIDPGLNASEIVSRVKEKGLEVKLIFVTHHHRDHSAGSTQLKETFGAEVAAHGLSPLKKDMTVKDGETVSMDGMKAHIIHTPGHTEDGICILIDGAVFTGDTLFVNECGRTDFPGGDSAALYDSLFGKLLKLSDDTIVYPGHDYGQRPHSTIGEERKTNYTLKKRTLNEFITFMREP